MKKTPEEVAKEAFSALMNQPGGLSYEEIAHAESIFVELTRRELLRMKTQQRIDAEIERLDSSSFRGKFGFNLQGLPEEATLHLLHNFHFFDRRDTSRYFDIILFEAFFVRVYTSGRDIFAMEMATEPISERYPTSESDCVLVLGETSNFCLEAIENMILRRLDVGLNAAEMVLAIFWIVKTFGNVRTHAPALALRELLANGM
jgi:hypothetical protein